MGSQLCHSTVGLPGPVLPSPHSSASHMLHRAYMCARRTGVRSYVHRTSAHGASRILAISVLGSEKRRKRTEVARHVHGRNRSERGGTEIHDTDRREDGETDRVWTGARERRRVKVDGRPTVR